MGFEIKLSVLISATIKMLVAKFPDIIVLENLINKHIQFGDASSLENINQAFRRKKRHSDYSDSFCIGWGYEG